MSDASREFLFTYRFGDSEWSTTVFADSPAEAKEKVKAMAWARYDGEMVARVYIPGGGFTTRFATWWRGK